MVITFWKSFGADNPISQLFHWGVRDGLSEILAEWGGLSFGADNPIDQSHSWGSLPGDEDEEDDPSEEADIIIEREWIEGESEDDEDDDGF